jgi:hypothetical protein
LARNARDFAKASGFFELYFKILYRKAVSLASPLAKADAQTFSAACEISGSSM